MTNLYKLTMYIAHDKFLKGEIDQDLCERTPEFELIPPGREPPILLGTAEDLEEKFRALCLLRLGLNNSRLGINTI